MRDVSLGRSEEEKEHPTKMRDEELLQMYPSKARSGFEPGSQARGLTKVATTLEPPRGSKSKEVRRGDHQPI